MKRFLLVPLLFHALLTFSQNKISLEGHYTEKNLYFQDNVCPDKSCFCTDSILVNKKKIKAELESSAFEVPLHSLGLNPGDTIYFELFYKRTCKPKLLQPEVITPRSTFELTSISIDKDNILHFTTSNEYNRLPYYIEQFRWNKWIKVGEIDGLGSIKSNNYTFALNMMHSGTNKFRVKQVGAGGNINISKSIEFIQQGIPEVKILDYSVDDDTLRFSGKTMYELYDLDGNIVKRGFFDKVDLKGLKRGHYYVCFDNQCGEFDKVY